MITRTRTLQKRSKMKERTPVMMKSPEASLQLRAAPANMLMKKPEVHKTIVSTLLVPRMSGWEISLTKIGLETRLLPPA